MIMEYWNLSIHMPNPIWIFGYAGLMLSIRDDDICYGMKLEVGMEHYELMMMELMRPDLYICWSHGRDCCD